jgi:hypothetical protein
MKPGEPASKSFSLKRWSQRKLEAARAVPDAVDAPAAVPVPPPAGAGTPQPVATPPSATVPLPPVESLTIDSDFTAFLQPKVDETLKRQALKQLFRDPHFNVMDGLDVYIDDYSIPDPISPEIVRQLVQGRYIFDPPATRVNARGEVEDVPPGDAATGQIEGEPAPLAGTEPRTVSAADPEALAQAAPRAMAEPEPEPMASAAISVPAGSGGASIATDLPKQPERHDGAVPSRSGRPGPASE